MPALRDLMSGAGYRDVKTLLNSGNVVFSGSGATPRIEARLERAAAEKLGLRTEFFVRTADELAKLIADNPFPVEARDDPGHLLVVFLKDAPGKGGVEDLQSAIPGREVVKAAGRQLYVTYPDGIGRSKVTIQLIERKLGTKGTGRNWNTVLKLRELAERA
jgi:uncharacterized protein (DUF1697 family)